MDSKNLIESVMLEVTAKARRRANVSPYKKAYNQNNMMAMKIVSDPSDSNIRMWSSKILAKMIGPRALKLTDADINEIRTVALLLRDINTYTPQQQSNFLIDSGRFSADNDQVQMQKLIAVLKTASDKEQLSKHQLVKDRIGSLNLIEPDKGTDTPMFKSTLRSF